MWDQSLSATKNVSSTSLITSIKASSESKQIPTRELLLNEMCQTAYGFSEHMLLLREIFPCAGDSQGGAF